MRWHCVCVPSGEQKIGSTLDGTDRVCGHVRTFECGHTCVYALCAVIGRVRSFGRSGCSTGGQYQYSGTACLQFVAMVMLEKRVHNRTQTRLNYKNFFTILVIFLVNKCIYNMWKATFVMLCILQSFYLFPASDYI